MREAAEVLDDLVRESIDDSAFRRVARVAELRRWVTIARQRVLVAEKQHLAALDELQSAEGHLAMAHRELAGDWRLQ